MNVAIGPFFQAVTVPDSHSTTYHYQPLETFGDSILKFSAALFSWQVALKKAEMKEREYTGIMHALVNNKVLS